MNISKQEFINIQLNYLRENSNKLVIDADTHITDIQSLSSKHRSKLLSTTNYYHGRPISLEQLLMGMNLSNIDMSLAWQNPACTLYTENKHENYKILWNANLYIANSAYKYPNRIIPAGWTDPIALGIEKAMEIARRCILELGFPIIKMNPAQNSYPIDSPLVFKVLDCIIEAGGIPAFHYGADTPYTRPKNFEKVVSQYPDVPFIGVHMGGGGASYVEAEDVYRESRELGLKHSNLRFILSAKRDSHIESDFITYQLAGEPFCHNLFCGSDAPYGNQAWNFGGFRSLLESFIKRGSYPDQRIKDNPRLFTTESIAGYLGGNFAMLLIETYEKLIRNQNNRNILG